MPKRKDRRPKNDGAAHGPETGKIKTRRITAHDLAHFRRHGRELFDRKVYDGLVAPDYAENRDDDAEHGNDR
jgi:hypothetical protein